MDTTNRITLQKLQYDADMLSLMELAKKWKAKAKENAEIKLLIDIIIRIDMYNRHLELERFSFGRILSENTAKGHRLYDRAHRAEEKVEELEKQLAEYKLKESLGL